MRLRAFVALLFVIPRLSRATDGGTPPPTLTPAQIAERALPSVVLIRTATELGTGFVVRADGRIATNLHVLAGAAEATVVLSDKRELPVLDVVDVDARHDLIVLHVAATGLTPLTLGNSDLIKPGETVVAIGHPMGLGNTVSNGLVSAVRELEPGFSLLQISAPISPGSSGGPLFNDHGEVIGTSTLVSTEGQNLNFGMPVNYLRPMVDKAGGIPLASLTAPPPARKKIRREIPNHPLSLLNGCSDTDLRTIREGIAQAIKVGAPLYNDGNQAACFRIYEGAALDLQRSMKTCSGPRKALLAGVKLASKTKDDSARAWRMRDAFDGVLDVIERKLGVAEAGAGRDLSARRLVPKYDVSVLKGCTGADVQLISKTIADAIELGAPLYNEGNIAACYRIYQSASLDLMSKLPRCTGLQSLLKEGLDDAEAKVSADAKAWALRDVLDGLEDVMTRAARDGR